MIRDVLFHHYPEFSLSKALKRGQSIALCKLFCIPRSTLAGKPRKVEGNQFLVLEPVALWARLGLNQRLLPCEKCSQSFSRYSPLYISVDVIL